LLLTEKESALDVKEKEERKALSKNVELVKAAVWSRRWFNLVLACILNLKELATSAEARVKSSMRRTNARFAMVRRSAKRRRFSKLKSTRDLPTVANTPSMVKLTSTQGLSLEM